MQNVGRDDPGAPRMMNAAYRRRAGVAWKTPSVTASGGDSSLREGAKFVINHKEMY